MQNQLRNVSVEMACEVYVVTSSIFTLSCFMTKILNLIFAWFDLNNKITFIILFQSL